MHTPTLPPALPFGIVLSTFLVACTVSDEARRAPLEDEALTAEVELARTAEALEEFAGIDLDRELDALPMSPVTIPEIVVRAEEQSVGTPDAGTERAEPVVAVATEPEREPEPEEVVPPRERRSDRVGDGRWPSDRWDDRRTRQVAEPEPAEPAKTPEQIARENYRYVPSQPPVRRPEPEAAPEMRMVTHRVEIGTRLVVRMNEGLSAKGDPVGSEFFATLTEPIVGDDGSTLVPRGARVRGRVIDPTEERRSTGADLAIVFTSVETTGSTYPIAASPTSLPLRQTGSSRASQAAKVGGGAVAGAILGRMIGRDVRGTVAGAAIGAAAGSAAAVATHNADVILDVGAVLDLRLDRPLEVERIEWVRPAAPERREVAVRYRDY